MRSERSYSGLEPVAAGCACEGSREGVVVTVSLSFVGSLTAAPPCVRELLDGFSRAQPVPRTTSMTKALRPIVRQLLFIILSSLCDSGSLSWCMSRGLSRSAGHGDDVLKRCEMNRLGNVSE